LTQPAAICPGAGPGPDAALPAQIEAPNPHGPVLSDATFACIAEIAHREAGLFLPAGKQAMVRTRLARRLRALGLTSYEAYCEVVRAPVNATERGMMISALTTNVSSFFREAHHFDILRDKVLPPLVAGLARGRRVRIWSAGCSNGQEPYSIAITLRDAGLPPGADLRILATDIDPVVVAHARAGEYADHMMGGIDDGRRRRYFEPVPGRDEVTWRAADTLRDLVVFRELNLLGDWPMRGRFDAIFCRNVVIYFDQDTQNLLWQRFAGALAPGGWLFLGHSERVSERNLHLLANRGVTTYQRTNDPVGGGAPQPA
jgi:chemotaxis protein methyltransferase CheR